MLSARAIVTLAQVKDFLTTQPSASNDQALERVIERASAIVEAHCKRRIMQTDYTTAPLYVQGSRYLRYLHLDHSPIDLLSTVAVTVDGEAQTVWKSATDGDQASFNVVVMPGPHPLDPKSLYRELGWCPSVLSRPNNVTVAYKGGFTLATRPRNLEEATLEIVKKIWTDQSKGIQDVTTVNLPTGGFTMFDRSMPRRAVELLEDFVDLRVAYAG